MAKPARTRGHRPALLMYAHMLDQTATQLLPGSVGKWRRREMLAGVAETTVQFARGGWQESASNDAMLFVGGVRGRARPGGYCNVAPGL
jgi:hypothetical protein